MSIPEQKCVVCDGQLERSEQFPDAGYLHVDDKNEGHVPIMNDHVSLPDGSALVERRTCECGTSITLYRGAWWNDDDTPHDCDDHQEGEAPCKT